MKLTTTLEKMKENKHSVISLCQLLDFLAKNNKRDEEIDLLDILDSLGLYSFLLALEDVLEDKKRMTDEIKKELFAAENINIRRIKSLINFTFIKYEKIHNM